MNRHFFNLRRHLIPQNPSNSSTWDFQVYPLKISYTEPPEPSRYYKLFSILKIWFVIIVVSYEWNEWANMQIYSSQNFHVCRSECYFMYTDICKENRVRYLGRRFSTLLCRKIPFSYQNSIIKNNIYIKV